MKDEATLIDLERAASRILKFARRIGSFDEFQQDDLAQSAVLHQLLILGEASKRLSCEFRDMHSDIPWSKMAKNRDRLIHGYDDINLRTVWDTVTEDVADVLPQFRALLPPA